MFRPSQALLELVADTLVYANGLAISPDDRLLFVAHALGIDGVDLSTSMRQPLTASCDC